jgi:hypothetical protein
MYKHTQIGWVVIFSLEAVFLLLFFGVLHSDPKAVMLFAFIMFMMALTFVTLTVSVTAEYIDLIFGIGLVRMHIKINEIVSSQIVTNKWWYGFGIHGWWGKGWLLNVSGLNAVQLKMKNGMFYRIGTDEPEKLYDAIQRRINNKY